MLALGLFPGLRLALQLLLAAESIFLSFSFPAGGDKDLVGHMRPHHGQWHAQVVRPNIQQEPGRTQTSSWPGSGSASAGSSRGSGISRVGGDGLLWSMCTDVWRLKWTIGGSSGFHSR